MIILTIGNFPPQERKATIANLVTNVTKALLTIEKCDAIKGEDSLLVVVPRCYQTGSFCKLVTNIAGISKATKKQADGVAFGNHMIGKLQRSVCDAIAANFPKAGEVIVPPPVGWEHLPHIRFVEGRDRRPEPTKWVEGPKK